MLPQLSLEMFLVMMAQFLSERSEAYSHKDMSEWFRFVPVRDNHLRFISYFLGSYWSDLSDFFINTTTGSRSIIFRISSRRIFIFDELLAMKSSIFLTFLEGKGYVSESCMYRKLANVFAIIDGTPFKRAACGDIFARNFFQPVFDKTERKS